MKEYVCHSLSNPIAVERRLTNDTHSPSTSTIRVIIHHSYNNEVFWQTAISVTLVRVRCRFDVVFIY